MRTTRSATSPGSSTESCRIATVELADGASPDARNYRVNCDAVRAATVGFRPDVGRPAWRGRARRGFRSIGLTLDDVEGPRYQRIATDPVRLAA